MVGKAIGRMAQGLLALMLIFALPGAAKEADDPSQAPKPRPMIFGAASNFSQGFRPAVFAAAQQLPLRHYRDGMRWIDVEQRPGQYRFTGPRRDYPARLAQIGAELTLTVNFGNPLYDEGHTPHSPEGLAAFGRFVAAMVEKYPAITAIEVGNEFNGANFVTGPVREAGLAQRGRYHLAMVEAASQAARAVRPDIRIYGGSTHSLPAGYLWPILDDGGALLDGLALHPYTTPIDQLARQIAVLRQHPLARRMPLVITEWGSASRERAPDDMLRGYATFAALGTQALYWYPLNERDDGLVPLIERDGTISQAGAAFSFIQAELGERSARDISPDAFTFAMQFGKDRMVLWGEPRDLLLARPDIEAVDARGQVLPRTLLRISPERPILLRSPRPFALGAEVTLGCSNLIADSFYQFSYHQAAPAGPHWEPSILSREGRLPFAVMPGQQRGGVPWNPYLAHPKVHSVRLDSETMVPSRRGGRSYAIAHRFLAAKAGQLRLIAELSAPGRQVAPARITIHAAGALVFDQTIDQQHKLDQIFSLQAGEAIEVLASPAGDARSAATNYRLKLYQPDSCINP